MSKLLKLSIVVILGIAVVLSRYSPVLAEAKLSITVTPSVSQPILAGGAVVYEYQIFNLGTGSLTDISVVDDKCSPVNYISGDVNNNKQLEKDEVWKYNCQMNLIRTTTNTATATGKLNGDSNSASATSTVVVQVPERSIKLIKATTPEKILEKSGQVVYSYEVTNIGSLTLNDITLTDDKCNNIVLALGDANNNNKLEPGEIWKYICNATLTASTTSVATVRGQSDGIYVTDVASVTVLVGKDAEAGAIVPKALPKTGGGGGAKSDLTLIWVSLAVLTVIGAANGVKKMLKKSYLGN